MAVTGIKIVSIDKDEVHVEIDPYLIETKSKEEVAWMVQQAIIERAEMTDKNRLFRRAEERGKK